MLESRAFTNRKNPGSNSCAFGLLPKFSTPVEKTVENHNFRCSAKVRGRFYGDFTGAKVPEADEMGLVGRVPAPEAIKLLLGRGEGPPKAVLLKK